MRRAAAIVVAFVAALAVAQVPMYSDYPWGLVNNGADKGPVWNLNCKPPLVCSVPSYGNGVIELCDGGIMCGLTLDDLPDGITYGRTRLGSLDAGYITQVQRAGVAYDLSSFFAFPLDTLDKVPEGVNFGRTARGDLDGGHVAVLLRQGISTPAEQLFKKASDLLPDTLDGVPDGTATARVLKSKLDAGSVVLDLTLDGTYGKVKADGITAGYPSTLTRGGSQYGTATFFNTGLDTLDAVTDGTNTARVAKANLDGGAVILDTTLEGTYGRVARSKLDGGSVVLDLTLDGTFAKVLTTALDAGYVTTLKRAGTATAAELLFQKAATTDPDTLDGVPDGTNTARVAKGKLDGGSVVLDLTLDGTFAKVLTTSLDAGYVTQVKRSGTAIATEALFKKALTTDPDTVDGVPDGTSYARTAAGGLTSGYVSTLSRGGSTYATSTFFQKALDNLDNVTDGTTYAKVNATAVSSGNPKTDSLVDGTYSKVLATYVDASKRVTSVWDGVSAAIAGSSIFRKSTDTFASVGGTLSDGQLGSNVVNTSNVKDDNITTAKVRDGLSFRAYDEMDKAGIIARGTSFTQVSCISDNFAKCTNSGTAPSWNVGLATVLTTIAPAQQNTIAIRYRTGAGTWNATHTGQFADQLGNKGSFTIYGDGLWHTAFADISGTAASINSITLSFPSNNAANGQVFELAYMAVGNAGPGTGSLVSVRGNAGLGLSAPTTPLHVRGSGNLVTYDTGAATGVQNATLLQDGTTTKWQVGKNTDNSYFLYDAAGAKNVIQAASNGNVSIQPASGFVGVGITPATAAYRLDIGGETAINPISLQIRPSAHATSRRAGFQFGSWLLGQDLNTNGTLDWFIYGGTTPANRFQITAAGVVTVPQLSGTGNRAVYSDATGALTNTSSDGTLKEQVLDLVAPLRTVLNLRPVSFNWKDKERFGPQREIGFIAQEVMGVVPEVVGTNADGTYTVDYPKLTAVLAGAVQELYADRTALAERVQLLEDKAAAAERQLADLEARLARLEAR